MYKVTLLPWYIHYFLRLASVTIVYVLNLFVFLVEIYQVRGSCCIFTANLFIYLYFCLFI